MSYIDRAKQNAEVAAKAAAFDKLQQDKREQDMYSKGANDISAEVERQLRSRTRPDVVSNLEQAWYNDPINQQLTQDAISSGFWDPSRDPTGAPSAVNKMLLDQKYKNDGLASQLIGR